MPCLPPTPATSVAVVHVKASLAAPADAIGARHPSEPATKAKRQKFAHTPKAKRPAKQAATRTPSPANEPAPRPSSTSPPPPKQQKPGQRAMTLPPDDFLNSCLPYQLPWQLTPQYTLHLEVGRGSYGAVYLATDEHQLLVAVKLMPRGSAHCRSDHALEELQNHHSVSYHPHAISFKEVLVTNNYLCLVMEYADGGNMRQFLDLRHPSGLPEDTARRFFQQLVLAVDFCHRKHVHLRDIRLENILVQRASPTDPSWLIKLCDFGSSRSDQVRTAPEAVATTLPYMAPEALQPTARAEGASGPATDIWSCGIILFGMLSGQLPYGPPPGTAAGALATAASARGYIDSMLQTIQSGRVCLLPGHVHVSQACTDLLHQLLDPVPDSRIRMEGVFRHPWFTVGLPATIPTFNQQLLRSQNLQVSMQTHEDINRLVARARYNSLQQQLSRGETSSSSLGY